MELRIEGGCWIPHLSHKVNPNLEKIALTRNNLLLVCYSDWSVLGIGVSVVEVIEVLEVVDVVAGVDVINVINVVDVADVVDVVNVVDVVDVVDGVYDVSD